MTGARPTKEKVSRLVAGLAPTITARFFDGYPLPAYTFDKINIGLIDAHEFAGDATALSVLDAATDAALPHLCRKGADASRDGGPAASQPRLHLGRILYPAGEPLSRLAARRGRSVTALLRAASCWTAIISSRWRAARTCWRAGMPTAT